MQRINKIQVSVDEIIEVCIENYRNSDLRQRFKDSIKFILDYSNDFDKRIIENSIHRLIVHDTVNNISKLEMTNLYNDKFVKAKTPGRKFYDQIILSSRNGMCPLCESRSVSTLDHFLPKSKYPTLAVTPSNLVPICWDCNNKKSNTSITSEYNLPLHPYFDNLGDKVWLKVNFTDNFTPIYSVCKSLEWDEILYNRVTNHFDNLQLNRLYSINASSEIIGLKNKWITIRNKADINYVFTDIHESFVSFESIDSNSWKTALYRALDENHIIVSNFLDSP